MFVFGGRCPGELAAKQEYKTAQPHSHKGCEDPMGDCTNCDVLAVHAAIMVAPMLNARNGLRIPYKYNFDGLVATIPGNVDGVSWDISPD